MISVHSFNFIRFYTNKLSKLMSELIFYRKKRRLSKSPSSDVCVTLTPEFLEPPGVTDNFSSLLARRGLSSSKASKLLPSLPSS